MTTFSLVFEQVQQKNEAAIEFLKLCAYLAPDAIPMEIITEGAARPGTVLEPVANDALRLNQALETLQAYSLVRRDGESGILSIHRLVQVVLQNAMDEAERHHWIEYAVLAINAAFPQVVHDTWPQCDRLLPHALLAAQYIETDYIISEETGHLLNETASYLQGRARYTEAEPLYRLALAIREQQLGPHHPQVADSLNKPGVLFYVPGRHVEAEPLYLRALTITEQQLGLEHPHLCYPLRGLATLYRKQGKYAEAESLYLRSLAIGEQQLEPKQPQPYELHGLAHLYFAQGQYEKAKPLYQRALNIREEYLGPEHPETAEFLHDFAYFQEMQGSTLEVLSLYQRALAIRERVLGLRHPKTRETQQCLLPILQELGRHKEAASLQEMLFESSKVEEKR